MVDTSLIEKFKEAIGETSSLLEKDSAIREVSYCYADQGREKDFYLSPQRLENLELLIERQLEAKLSSVEQVSFLISQVKGAADGFYSELEWLTTWAYHLNHAMHACDSTVGELKVTAYPSGFYVQAKAVKCRRNHTDIKLKLKKLFKGFAYGLKVGPKTLEFEADLTKNTINLKRKKKMQVRAKELLVNA